MGRFPECCRYLRQLCGMWPRPTSAVPDSFGPNSVPRRRLLRDQLLREPARQPFALKTERRGPARLAVRPASMPGPLQDLLDFQFSFPAPLIKSPQLPGGRWRCLRKTLGCRAARTVPRGRFLAHAHGWIVPLRRRGGQGLQAFLQATAAIRRRRSIRQ